MLTYYLTLHGIVQMGIEFQKIPIDSSYGIPIYNIYVVIENGRSRFFDGIGKLTDTAKKDVRDLISRMATVENFKSKQIKHCLTKYSYGEIKPLPHRFFFFQKCGKNFVFFEYKLKKKDSLRDYTYKHIETNKVRYEKEFQKFISGN